MAELNAAADRYISALLSRTGRVPPEALDWVPEAERAALLQQYCAEHPGAADVGPDGVLAAAQVPVAPPQPPAQPQPTAPSQPPAPTEPVAVVPPFGQLQPSPAFGAVAASATPTSAFNPDSIDPRYFVAEGSGKALLDSKPAGKPVSRWMYLLPLFFGLVGGLIGWVITKDENPRGARNVLLVGVVVTAISMCFSLAMGTMAASTLRQITGGAGAYPGSAAYMASGYTRWPATGAATGKPALYYFGTST